jgi:hypothetical protein
MRARYEVWLVAMALSVCVTSPSLAFGDFPRASCGTWNGTVVGMSGVNTRHARMSGIITRADVQEYCDRDSGSETIRNGGKLTVAQCVARYYRKLRHVKLLARADCARATLEFHDGNYPVQRVQIPVEYIDCMSGRVPLIYQFEKLCPTRTRELKMTWPRLEKVSRGK